MLMFTADSAFAADSADGGETGDTGGETGAGTDTDSGLGLDSDTDTDSSGGDNYEADNDLIVETNQRGKITGDSFDAGESSQENATPRGFGDSDTSSLSSLGTFDVLRPVSSIEEERILGAWDDIE